MGTFCFPYLSWIDLAWRRQRAAVTPWTGGEPALRLSPEQFGAALLMGYLGGFSLGELGELAGLDRELLLAWRRLPLFLEIMDHSKAVYARAFPEYLLGSEFSWTQFQEMAAEFRLLEDSLRVRLRICLYLKLQTLGPHLAGGSKASAPPAEESTRQFRSLFGFFWALEAFWPSAARAPLMEQWFPVARERAWPPWEPLPEKPWEEAGLLQVFRKSLAGQITQLFRRVR